MIALVFGTASTLAFSSNTQAENNTKQLTAPSKQGAQQQRFAIEAGTLDQALNQFSKQANINLAINGKLTSGKQSKGLQGTYSIPQGLDVLLSTAGLHAIKLQDGSYIIKKSSDNDVVGTLATTKVTTAKTGSAEDGYRVENTKNIGVLNGKAIIDTPYSIAVLPADLLENTIASSVDQIFRMSPTIQVATPSIDNDLPEINMRGFASDQGLLDGIAVNNMGLSLEEMEQVEILTGTSGFLYGPGNVGGRVNYVYKRPTQQRLTKVTLGNYGGSQYFMHADLGGNIDNEGIFGYRVNVVKQSGDTSIENENVDKFLISGAFDWHISDTLLAQVVASHRDYQIEGKQAQWYNKSSAAAFDAPSSSKAYGPQWVVVDNETNSLKFDLTWNINKVFTLRSAYLTKQVDIPLFNYADNWLLSEVTAPWYEDFGAEVGNFIQWNSRRENMKRESTAINMFLDANFETSGTAHNITIGYSSGEEEYAYGANKSFEALHTSLDALNTTIEPDWSSIAPRFGGVSYRQSANENIFIADEIIFNQQWSTQLGLNYVSLKSNSGNEEGGWEEEYDTSALTPTVSILYKPKDNLTTYFTYMEALEEGSIVDESYHNVGDALTPLQSKEVELGVKYKVSDTDLLLTTALFRIEKPNEYSLDIPNQTLPSLVQDGLAVHQGIELGFTGKATENLTLLGGLTVLDAKTKDSDEPDLEDERIEGVANTMAKLYVEYALPTIKGLVFTGGVYYTGSATWNQGDDYKTDAYTLVDLGLRYSDNLKNIPMTFRLSVTNLTDKDYWLNKAHLGTPRSIAFSMTADF
jgi:iron complex outermembrane receptor protein